jgi:DNA-binding ferritin-like protein
MSADKIVSLRQIQRRSKAKFKKYRSQTRISQKSQTLAVNSLINDSNLLINKSSDFFNKTNELSDSTNNGIFIATSTSLDDFFFQNESVKKKGHK